MMGLCRQTDRNEPVKQLQAGGRIEKATRRLLQHGRTGAYHASFPGSGMEHKDTRTYLPGDDLKSIDGKATARTGVPLIKTWGEEGNRMLLLLVDISASTDFGSTGITKREKMAELGSMLALAALNNNDRVGLVLFSDIIELYLPPARGRTHVLRLTREIFSYRAQHPLSDLSLPLDFISRLYKRKAVVLLISDFSLTGAFARQLGHLSITLQRCRRKHELLPIMVSDPREHELPDCGLLTIEDLENGRQVQIDSARPSVRHAWREHAAQRRQQLQRTFRATGIEPIDVRTDQTCHHALFSLFRARNRRSARR